MTVIIAKVLLAAWLAVWVAIAAEVLRIHKEGDGDL